MVRALRSLAVKVDETTRAWRPQEQESITSLGDIAAKGEQLPLPVRNKSIKNDTTLIGRNVAYTADNKRKAD